MSMHVQIPAGTQMNETFTVKGKGIHRLNNPGCGNQYVHCTVQIPK